MLSVPKILSQHPLLTPLFDEGLEWYVWKEWVEKKYTKLPDIFQRGCNAKFSVQQGMDMWQVFLRACTCWANGVANAKADPSGFILKDISRSNPTCSSQHIEALVEIARKFGGSNEAIVSPLKAFLSAFKIPSRMVSLSSLQALAALKMTPDQICPNFVMSILMVLASSPTANIITSGDIKGMFSTKHSRVDTLKDVEEMLQSMIVIASQADAKDSLKIVSEFRSQVVLKFFDKKKALKDIA